MPKRTVKRKSPEANHIYVASLFGYYKIGRTWNVDQRMKSLSQTLLPAPFVIVLSSRVYSGPKVEKALHNRYSSKRIRGEWFSLDSQDIDDIKQFLESKHEPCTCIAYGGPPRMCAEAVRLWRDLGNLSHKPMPESTFMQTPYARHFLEL